MKRLSAAAVGLAVTLLVAGAWAEEPSAALNFVVVRDYSGKPVRNASVVLHPVNARGRQQRGGYELKTDSDGKTSFDGVPYGKLRVQVLAPGFQTFGEDYDIEGPTMDITVKLKRPQKQYSIYDEHPNDGKKDAAPGKNAEKKDPGEGDGKPQ
ncbi:MAG TPA: carboxypeptidase-like regulatory domain-containing protein [Terriglobales bacterium]|nr:carboxypeptidase-like regulatory domain-containing protein [Terriglobales bacterium]